MSPTNNNFKKNINHFPRIFPKSRNRTTQRNNRLHNSGIKSRTNIPKKHSISNRTSRFEERVNRPFRTFKPYSNRTRRFYERASIPFRQTRQNNLDGYISSK